MSSSDMLATISFSSGYLPKKCSRVYAPPLALKFWYSPSTHSIIRRRSSPFVSRANSGSQREPQITLMTFQPAPRNTDSSSWMICPLPRTGPSSRCRLQLMTKMRLSSFSRAASEKRPHLLVGRRLEAAVLEILDEPRLVDRRERSDAHRDRGVFPEVGHQ